MKKLLTTLAIVTVVATPAFAAQSYRYQQAYQGDPAYPSCPEAQDSVQWRALAVNSKAAFCDHARGAY